MADLIESVNAVKKRKKGFCPRFTQPLWSRHAADLGAVYTPLVA